MGAGLYQNFSLWTHSHCSWKFEFEQDISELLIDSLEEAFPQIAIENANMDLELVDLCIDP